MPRRRQHIPVRKQKVRPSKNRTDVTIEGFGDESSSDEQRPDGWIWTSAQRGAMTAAELKEWTEEGTESNFMSL
jgi:hypothetical protein